MNDYSTVRFSEKFSNTNLSLLTKPECSKLAQLPLNNLKKPLDIPLFFIFCAIAACATVLNSMTLILCCKNTHLRRKRSVKLLLSLAASDLSVGVFVAPISITQILWQDIPRCHFINIIARSSHLIMMITLLIMCNITLEQYLKIVKHDVYHEVLTSLRFKAFLAAPWIITFLLLLIAAISSVTTVWIVVVSWFSLFVVIFATYWKIHAHLQNRQKYWRKEEHSNIVTAINKQNRKITRMMLIIAVGVSVCSIAGYCSKVLHLLEHYQVGDIPWLKTWRQYHMGTIANILQQSNSVLNPILFYCRSSEFSKASKRLVAEVFRCCRPVVYSTNQNSSSVRSFRSSYVLPYSSRVSKSSIERKKNVSGH